MLLKRSSGYLRIPFVPQAGLKPLPGYQLCRQRGRGNFGEVWEADGPEGSKVALKFIPTKHSRLAVQELRNLQALRQLDHPNLLPYDKIWSHFGYLIITMDLADGSLEDLYQEYQMGLGTPMVPKHACFMLAQAAEALDFLNFPRLLGNNFPAGIQHCDVKPSNLLLFGQVVKVVDFGLSSPMNASQETRYRGGTPDYCAPEVFRGRISPQTDQFALAVTYCHLRGGFLPFRNSPVSLMDPCRRDTPDLSMLDMEEQPIVARALDPVPMRRWTSCREFMQQLTRVVDAVEHRQSRSARP